MLAVCQTALAWLIRLAAGLRYRVEIRGAEQFRGLSGPTLVMPNHPGYIDPILVLSHIRPGKPVRPAVTEGMYRKPLLYPFMRLVDALEVPDLEQHSREAREQTLAMIDAVAAGLRRGESFLVYPSGRVQRRGREVIGAARAAAEILERCPEANVVLVRTRGVWGSMFSWAQTGSAPRLGRCVLRALGWLMASLLVFLPRRRVTITLQRLDLATLPGRDRDSLNRYLEEWYNADGPEAPTFVPYHPFLGPRRFAFPDLDAAGEVERGRIKPATIQAVNEMLEEHLGRPLLDDEEQAQTPLDQLGLDSLDRMDLALKIEDRFGFRSDRVASTLGEFWALAEGLLAGGAAAPLCAPPAWTRADRSAGPAEVLAETLAEAMVRRALAHPGEVAVADRLSGVLTYRRFLVGARLLSRRLRAVPGDAVGVMLPSSVAADLVFFALHLAGKLPVMLNWTTGPANLAHAVRTLGIRGVVTSRRLIDRLRIDVEGANYVFLEDVRTQIGKGEAAAAMVASYVRPGRALAELPRPGADDPAVVLFTSGSESAPKAVPLTHRNLVTNVRAGLAVLEATRVDVMLACLPPFHSFGLTANLLAPLLGGMRVVHHPDPTDAAGLVETVAAYRATLLFTTPTFLSYMLAVARPEDFEPLRVAMTGAEKCPEAVAERARVMLPQAAVLEGYGITECSPAVSANRVGRAKAGSIGAPVPGVEVCVVDPESREPLPADARGLLLVRGPSIFHGYLKYDGPDPFVEAAGHRWYNTGDLVRIDPEGFLHFCGRLKRFLKAAGEMISLPALEEPLARLYPPGDAGPQVAVEGVETPEGRWIVLFSTAEVSLRQANAALAEAGLRGVMRLDEVVRLEQIPVLGTGKTDYKRLRAMIAEKAQAQQRHV